MSKGVSCVYFLHTSWQLMRFKSLTNVFVVLGLTTQHQTQTLTRVHTRTYMQYSFYFFFILCYSPPSPIQEATILQGSPPESANSIREPTNSDCEEPMCTEWDETVVER